MSLKGSYLEKMVDMESVPEILQGEIVGGMRWGGAVGTVLHGMAGRLRPTPA